MISLITGATRSGKSSWAQHLAMESGQPVIYLATAMTDPEDAEWEARLAHHRQNRPAAWQVWEIPQKLPEAIRSVPMDHFVLLDALGTWVANCLEESDPRWEQTEKEFLAALKTSELPMAIVGEEVGWGVVPAYASGRLFRDRMGRLLRRVGHIADRVYLVTGGYALDLAKIAEKLPAETMGESIP